MMGTIGMTNQKSALWTLPCFEEELTKMLGSRTKKELSPEGMVTAAVLVPLFTKKRATPRSFDQTV